MAVKPRTEKEIEAFIEEGASVKSDKVVTPCSMIQLRTPICYLERIDECIRKEPHLNRTQWIMGAIVEKLERE